MKDKKWIFIILVILFLIGIGIYFFFFVNSNPNTNPTPGTRVSTDVSNSQTNDSQNSNGQKNADSTQKESVGVTEGLEKEIAKFSTKIMEEDHHRDNNMEISLSKLNNTIVKAGDTFSFNETVGSPTPNEGYEKAGVFVEDKYKKDYGGGNCQVSTTLYNAVLKVDNLKVTERHEHTQEVYYVPLGKDAAVAYGEIDFKFQNNTGHDIKIYGEMTEKEVKIKLIQLN
ncbi:MAG: hypothetical protein HFJ30_08250 [Clostridia bacterium]|jgi:vancomycin resistance protein YoaR|nr:hypothetical protein [Clostridia bacterium]